MAKCKSKTKKGKRCRRNPVQGSVNCSTHGRKKKKLRRKKKNPGPWGASAWASHMDAPPEALDGPATSLETSMTEHFLGPMRNPYYPVKANNTRVGWLEASNRLTADDWLRSISFGPDRDSMDDNARRTFQLQDASLPGRGPQPLWKINPRRPSRSDAREAITRKAALDDLKKLKKLLGQYEFERMDTVIIKRLLTSIKAQLRPSTYKEAAKTIRKAHAGKKPRRDYPSRLWPRCATCGQTVSDRSSQCPHCGSPISFWK